jgi:hypothetical protein
VGDLLATIPDSEAKKLLQNFISIRSGASIAAPKAAELAKNRDLTPDSLFQFFAKRNAISSSDLPEIVDAVIQKLPTQNQQPLHRKLTRFCKAIDYKPHDLLLIIDNLRVVVLGENVPVPQTPLKGLLVTGSIKSHRARVVLSRQALLGGTVTLNEVPKLLIDAAYREESEQVYSVLELNANLPDELPLFGEGNTAHGSSLVDLGAALTVFRSQKTMATSGELTCLEPRYLIVPAAQEIPAYKELFACGLTGKIEVVSTAFVTSTFLLADPLQAPVLIRLSLTDNPFIESKPASFQSDSAIAIDVYNDYKILPVSRLGAVKLQVTPP